MLTIDVPHYKQKGGSDCQAASAAMVLDKWGNRHDGGSTERLGRLFEEFSFGFRPKSGCLPPAITGLVAMAIADKGFTVDFYSKNSAGGGIEGLKFLIDGEYGFDTDDVADYAKHAAEIMRNASGAGVIVLAADESTAAIETAIAANKPVVAIVDVKILKGARKKANHAVVIAGIDETSVSIQDSAHTMSNKIYSREKFFEAHWRTDTDYDMYIVSPVS